MKTKKSMTPILCLALSAVVAFTTLSCGSKDSAQIPNPGSKDNAQQAQTPPASSVSSPTAAYGTWDLPPLSSNGVDFYASLTLREGNAKLTNRCVRGGFESSVSVDGSAEISADQIKIPEERTRTESHYGLDCTATLHKGTLRYSVNGDELKLFGPKGEIVLIRRMNEPSLDSSAIAPAGAAPNDSLVISNFKVRNSPAGIEWDASARKNLTFRIETCANGYCLHYVSVTCDEICTIDGGSSVPSRVLKNDGSAHYALDLTSYGKLNYGSGVQFQIQAYADGRTKGPIASAYAIQ